MKRLRIAVNPALPRVRRKRACTDSSAEVSNSTMNKIKSNVPDCCKVQRNLHIAHCPLCKRKGGPVTQTTIDSLVVEERKRELESIVGFRFCTTPSCELAYFNSKTGEQIAKTMVRVPIGIKEGSSPRQICYCFNHSQESIEKEIQTTEDNLNDTNYKLDKVNREINSVFAEIKVLDTKRKNILDNIDKVADLEKKYEAYEYYLDAVKRDGVPYELITKALPTIEGEVNNILAQLVDFQMIFEMDGKNINNYIVYDDKNIWPLELSSGMERFISSLAIRVGLINVSNLPRSNFLAIDEGWGTMDSDNLNSVYNLFQYLKSQFQFTLIVSHIDSMRDAVDTLLEVKKEDEFSNIIFD